ncbi:lysophospholipid acyltransferase family protein [Mycoplasmopsis gallinarum]
MSFKAKMFFLFPFFLWHVWRIRVYARKYRRTPEQYTLQQRNDWLLRKAKRLIKWFNINLEVKGYDELPKAPVLLVPNHKSNLDAILILAALAKQTKEEGVRNKIPTFLAKNELLKSKVAKATLELCDTFFINRKDIRDSFKQLAKFGNFVKENLTYGVIFPEGTRIKGDELGEFKAGAFKTAISNYISVVPVAIHNSENADNKNRKEKLKITVEFLRPIRANDVITSNPEGLAKRTKEAISGALKNAKN